MSLVPEKGSVGEKVGNISHMIPFFLLFAEYYTVKFADGKKRKDH